jgi:hypothetical protein
MATNVPIASAPTENILKKALRISAFSRGSKRNSGPCDYLKPIRFQHAEADLVLRDQLENGVEVARAESLVVYENRCSEPFV